MWDMHSCDRRFELIEILSSLEYYSPFQIIKTIKVSCKSEKYLKQRLFSENNSL